jgi:hypothetical protein
MSLGPSRGTSLGTTRAAEVRLFAQHYRLAALQRCERLKGGIQG